MNTTYYWKRFSQHENELIHLYRQGIQHLNLLSKMEFDDVLIQSAKVSLNFVPWYDRAIICLEDKEAKQVLREILQDETPLNAPSHREDLFADLAVAGISAKRVLMAPTSEATKKTVNDLNGLVRWSCDCDVAIMAGCRMAGEILVAESYWTFLPILKKHYGLTEQNSKFYWPHYLHDKKEGGEGDHTHSFENVLQRMMVDEQTLAIAKERANYAFRIRSDFYAQFDKVNYRKAVKLREEIAKHPNSGKYPLRNIAKGLSLLIDDAEEDLVLELPN